MCVGSLGPHCPSKWNKLSPHMDCLFGAVWEFSCFIAYEFTVSCVRRGTCIFEKLHFFYLCARPWWSFDGEDLMLALFRFHFFKCFFILALKNCLTQLYLNFSPSSYIYCKHLHFCFLSWSISSSNVQSAPVTLENSCVSHQHKMYTSLYNSLSLSLSTLLMLKRQGGNKQNHCL